MYGTADIIFQLHHFIFGEIFFTTTTQSKLLTFMLVLLCLYFSSYIFASAEKIANIIC